MKNLLLVITVSTSFITSAFASGAQAPSNRETAESTNIRPRFSAALRGADVVVTRDILVSSSIVIFRKGQLSATVPATVGAVPVAKLKTVPPTPPGYCALQLVKDYSGQTLKTGRVISLRNESEVTASGISILRTDLDVSVDFLVCVSFEWKIEPITLSIDNPDYGTRNYYVLYQKEMADSDVQATFGNYATIRTQAQPGL